MLAARDVVFGVCVAAGVTYPFHPAWMAGFDIVVPTALRLGGMALSVASLMLLAWTHHALGSYWSAGLELQSRHRLIRSGPYRLVRHPMYSSVFGFFGGVALLTANLLVIMPVVTICVVLFVRIGFEERMMRERFGDEYVEYCRGAGRLLPRFPRSART